MPLNQENLFEGQSNFPVPEEQDLVDVDLPFGECGGFCLHLMWSEGQNDTRYEAQFPDFKVVSRGCDVIWGYVSRVM